MGTKKVLTSARLVRDTEKGLNGGKAIDCQASGRLNSGGNDGKGDSGSPGQRSQSGFIGKGNEGIIKGKVHGIEVKEKK